MRPDARAWFRHRTTSAPSLADLDPAALLRAKRPGGHTFSVVLPARDEEAAAGPLVTGVGERWMLDVPLVDERVVVDPAPPAATAAVARGAGPDVVATTDVLRTHGPRPGK